MATGKRYYWIKLKESFMTSDAVDFLMGQPNGANYVVLYQMLCLKTINTDGRMERRIGEVIIPYDVEKIQRDTKWFSVDTIRVALNLYKALGLIYQDQDGVLSIADHKNLVGSETDWADKRRRQRSESSSPALPGGDNVPTDVPQNVPIDIRDRDKELDTRDRGTEVEPKSSNNNKDVPKKTKDTFAPDSKPYMLAVFLGKRIKKRLPSTEEPKENTLQSWADAFDKCNRLDGHSWDEIKQVLKFSQDDPFWQQNILSGKKFRAKYVELLAKMSSGRTGAEFQRHGEEISPLMREAAQRLLAQEDAET